MKLAVAKRLEGRDREAWLDLWSACPAAHPRQHPAFGELERFGHRRPLYLAGQSGSETVAAGVLSIGRMFAGHGPFADAVAVRGPIFRDVERGQEFLSLAMRWAEQNRIGRLRVAPFWRFPDAAPVAAMLANLGFEAAPDRGGLSADTGVIDLAPEEAAILAGLSNSARYQIRLAARRGIRVEPAVPASGSGEFFACFAQMRREAGLSIVSWQEFEAMAGVFDGDPSLGAAFEARADGRFMGGLWVMRTPTCAIATKYAVSKECLAGDNLSVGPALFWAALQWAKSAGCTAFDVDGYHPNLPQDHPSYSWCEFKKRLRPTPSRLLPEHSRVCAPLIDGAASVLHVAERACARGWRFVGRAWRTTGKQRAGRTRRVAARAAERS